MPPIIRNHNICNNVVQFLMSASCQTVTKITSAIHYFWSSFRWFWNLEPSQKPLHKSYQKTSKTDLQKGEGFGVSRNHFLLKIDPGPHHHCQVPPDLQKSPKSKQNLTQDNKNKSIQDAHRPSVLLKTGDCINRSTDPPTIQASNPQTYWRQTGPAGCVKQLNNENGERASTWSALQTNYTGH